MMYRSRNSRRFWCFTASLCCWRILRDSSLCQVALLHVIDLSWSKKLIKGSLLPLQFVCIFFLLELFSAMSSALSLYFFFCCSSSWSRSFSSCDVSVGMLMLMLKGGGLSKSQLSWVLRKKNVCLPPQFYFFCENKIFRQTCHSYTLNEGISPYRITKESSD